jgi:hypothetical protein
MSVSELTCHVAVVSSDQNFGDHWIDALNECADQDAGSSACCGFRFIAVGTADEALALALEDGLLQAVVIDAVRIDEAEELAGKLRARRAELDMFLAVEHGSAVPDINAELLNRDDGKISHLYRQIQTAVQRRARTPFADTLRDYVCSAKDAWHTPGHSGGDSLRDSPWVADFYQMMGEHIFNTDLSVSVQVLDSLLEPHSVIQEAQDLAAECFGAKKTFFVRPCAPMHWSVVPTMSPRAPTKCSPPFPRPV